MMDKYAVRKVTNLLDRTVRFEVVHVCGIRHLFSNKCVVWISETHSKYDDKSLQTQHNRAKRVAKWLSKS